MASPAACATYAATPTAPQCNVLRPPLALPAGAYHYLGTAAELSMVATPACAS